MTVSLKDSWDVRHSSLAQITEGEAQQTVVSYICQHSQHLPAKTDMPQTLSLLQ